MTTSFKSKTAIVGIGASKFYRRGTAPVSEFRLTCDAILAAIADAGLSVDDIDGLASFSDERSTPMRIASALGMPDVAFSNLFWEGLGGGCAGAVANAAAAVHAGYARYVVVYRGLSQGAARMGRPPPAEKAALPLSFLSPYAVLAPIQFFAMRVRRFMHEHGVKQDALAAIALAAYHHAQLNPAAVMHGRPLTRKAYDESRWIVEPFHLFDCALESDSAAALVITTAERARDLRHPPAYLLGAAQGADFRQSHMATLHNSPDYGTANFKSVAKRLYASCGIGPKDVSVSQVYENFSGGALMSMVEHGLLDVDEIEQKCTVENLTWPKGSLPINTSGGCLAECYTQGLAQVNEAVRQIRGTSSCQVDNAEIALVVSGPMVAATSSLVLHR